MPSSTTRATSATRRMAAASAPERRKSTFATSARGECSSWSTASVTCSELRRAACPDRPTSTRFPNRPSNASKCCRTALRRSTDPTRSPAWSTSSPRSGRTASTPAPSWAATTRATASLRTTSSAGAMAARNRSSWSLEAITSSRMPCAPRAGTSRSFRSPMRIRATWCATALRSGAAPASFRTDFIPDRRSGAP